ncbi:MAG: peptidase S8 [Alphaproteobacteria bacterium]|nr:peptidase S8 [Alphaproteobacteria bacterium]
MQPVTRGALVLVATSLGVVWGAADPGRREADLEDLRDGVDHAHEAGRSEVRPSDDLLVLDLVDGTDDATLDRVEALLGADLAWFDDTTRDEAIAVGRVGDVAAALALIEGAGLPVEVAEAVVEVEALGYPDDPLFGRQWHLPAMHAEAGWWHTPAGKGVIVAVVDTGIRAVEDLDAGRVLPGRSFVAGVVSADDDNGHGTHVAGTIAQTTHNGVGVAGVAPHALLLPVKVLSRFGGGTSVQVAAGIHWAVEQGAQVINLSLGSGRYSALIHHAVKRAHRAGVIVVAAAGNDGGRRVSWPGALPEAIGVAATGPDGSPAPYSNAGKGVDVAAPGGDKRRPGGGVWQDTIDGEGHAYKEFQGTSMATPHVAGAAAALLSTGVLDARGVERVLLAGADEAAWSPELGWGRLDLEAALALTGLADGMERGALGAFFAFVVASVGGLAVRRRLLAAVAGLLAAGGVPVLGTFGGWGGALLSRGVLAWPGLMLGPSWVHVGAWLAGGLAIGLVVLGGGPRWSRAAVLGICAGVGADVVWVLASGLARPWWLPGAWSSTWLALQAVVAIFAALAVAGLDRLDPARGSAHAP